MSTPDRPTSRIAVGNDEAAAAMRERVAAHLRGLGHEVDLFGPARADDPVHYPDVAVDVARRVADGTYARAVLICGTGIGMAIAANKVPGVRAAQAADTYSAERARKSNDAQVLCLGARTLGEELALAIVDAWLDSEFAGGRSQAKVDKLRALDDPSTAAQVGGTTAAVGAGA